jgi:ribosome maturation factor RimP
LSTPRQFKKNLGRQLKVKTKDSQETIGLLTENDDQSITLDVTVKEKGKKTRTEARQINLSDIAKAIVVISFK